jgi:hypothetical protein
MSRTDSSGETLARFIGLQFERVGPRRATNGCGGRSTGTSVVPQIANYFRAPRKSAALGQLRSSSLDGQEYREA